MSDFEWADLIDQLGDAAMKAKETIREAHAAKKDLDHTIAECKRAKAELEGCVAKALEEGVGAIVVEEMKTVQPEIQLHVNKTAADIQAEFHRMAEPLKNAMDIYLKAGQELKQAQVGAAARGGSIAEALVSKPLTQGQPSNPGITPRVPRTAAPG